MKWFSDFSQEKVIDGPKIKLDEIINKEITVIGYKLAGSKYKKENSGRCLTLQFELDGKKFICFTGSSVLIDQIERYQSEIPFITIIKKVDKYYTFS